MTNAHDSDGRVLLARGFPIQIIGPGGELADVDLHFESISLARLEEEFDSLDDFAAMLSKRPINTVAAVFRVTMGLRSQDEALRLIDSRQVRSYMDAIGSALEEALGSQDANSGNPPAPGSESRGAGSTGSPSSAGASIQNGSGT